jgi:hypothetical protein
MHRTAGSAMVAMRSVPRSPRRLRRELHDPKLVTAFDEKHEVVEAGHLISSIVA